MRELVERLIAREADFRRRAFLAPVTRGGRVCARVAGLLHTFRLTTHGFEGWGILEPLDWSRARLRAEASAAQVERYLARLKPFRLIMVRRLAGSSWLAYPANESDMHQRLGYVAPVLVNLAAGADAFEQAVSRFDGRNFWFEALDRNADPRLAAYLRRSAGAERDSEGLRAAGLTPEMRHAFDLAVLDETAAIEGSAGGRPMALQDERRRREDRLATARQLQPESLPRRALAWAGGQLDDLMDRGDAWIIRWRIAGGGPYTSLIRKSDLAVLSAGVCLDERDQDFDLQSLVSVMEELRKDYEW